MEAGTSIQKHTTAGKNIQKHNAIEDENVTKGAHTQFVTTMQRQAKA